MLIYQIRLQVCNLSIIEINAGKNEVVYRFDDDGHTFFVFVDRDVMLECVFLWFTCYLMIIACDHDDDCYYDFISDSQIILIFSTSQVAENHLHRRTYPPPPPPLSPLLHICA